MKLKKHIYEIYTTDGDLLFVLANKETIKLYPKFEVIVTVDDFPNIGPKAHRPKLINWV